MPGTAAQVPGRTTVSIRSTAAQKQPHPPGTLYVPLPGVFGLIPPLTLCLLLGRTVTNRHELSQNARDPFQTVTIQHFFVTKCSEVTPPNPFSLEAARSNVTTTINTQTWITDARRRLAESREKKPDTKAGQIWALWPEIRAALDDGQSMKSVSLWLNEAGVVVDSDNLRSYIRRCRRKEAGRGTLKSAKASPAPAYPLKPSFQNPRTAPEKSIQTLNSKGGYSDRSKSPDDPMALAREALNKPRFDIRKIHGDGDPSDHNLI